MRDIEEFTARYIAVWHEPDPVARASSVREIWASDGAEYVETEQFLGHDALIGRVSHAYDELVAAGGYVFRLADKPLAHHAMVTFTIDMAPAAGGPVEWSGRMVLQLDEEDRIRLDHQFTLTG